MYLLNLLFDLRRNDGLFSDSPPPPPPPAPPNPLDQSRSWLALVDAAGNSVKELTSGDPTNLPAGTSWQIIGEVPLFIPNAKDEAIGVRVAPIAGSSPTLGINSTIQLALAFGAVNSKVTKQASPFIDGDKAVTTVINSGRQTPPAAIGWYFRIHEINIRGKKNVADRYEFTVGAITGRSSCRRPSTDPDQIGLRSLLL